ncbi:unnamed protein product [Rotaria sp. Silwood1]|nr:unnamed protein product [Rotaria sp. Silwood1]CAF3844741.1 unnamed protein product [Rotaria sp. Silwood1]CAF4757845.1 unnamed protein product [Rotaria sp. Silwood1]
MFTLLFQYLFSYKFLLNRNNCDKIIILLLKYYYFNTMTKFILSIFVVAILLIHIINGRYLDFDYKTENIYKRGCSVSLWCTGGVCYGSCGWSSCLLQDPHTGLPGKCESTGDCDRCWDCFRACGSG